MIVTLIGKNVMYRVQLPQVAIGSYWISDKDEENNRKLISIEGKNGNWQIYSNNFVKIINPKWLISEKNKNLNINSEAKILENAIIKEYSVHYVCLENSDDIFVLYAAPTFESNFMHLVMKNMSEISVGSSENNSIVYNNSLVKNTHARLFLNNGRWMIENLDNKFGTFVNKTPIYDKPVFLFNGDVIFIMGLRIFMIGRNLYINNPLNRVTYSKSNFSLSEKAELPLKLKDENEADTELYSKYDFFARMPRITNIIEHEKVKIDPPPTIQNKEGMPLIYVLGSSLSMGGIMMVSVIKTIDGLANGTASVKDTIFSLIMSVAMLISMILFPILNVKYDKKQKIKYEEKRQKRYKEYINSKIKYIDIIMNKQKKILFEEYSAVDECARIILNKNYRLWERKIEDYDFLQMRIGTGQVPLDIEIQYPEKQFAMEDDNLVEILNTLANKSKTIEEAPITISLAERNISALVVQEDIDLKEKFIQNILLQLITFHSYEDLKLVFLLKEDKGKKWEYVKMLPHIWNNTKQIRFFADNYDEMLIISKYLEDEFASRVGKDNKNGYKSFSPYYLIITDDYKKIENLKIITEILNEKSNVGFSLFCISNSLMQLPNECKTFINLESNMGIMFESEVSSANQKKFIFDDSQTLFFEKITKKLANIPIKFNTSGKMIFQGSYTFLEMYDVGRIEQLNILERWKNNDATTSLRAPIGVDDTGLPIFLDIHEKFHGPHGLVAGSTGSGKSEFLITYILSLAVNYHPNDLAFILIDYKGGGLAGAFQKREIKLPHLVGTITNIDTVGLQRSLASIQSELRRRQIIFNEARNKTDEGTIDIYKYQKMFHEGIVDEPIPHLLIICDEFAELKQQQQEFMDELISVARIGRSLGVHLILATQKPAGIVNDQIRSNSRFGICLKVQDRQDSNDVIKRPDAANLKKAGQFYIQVGNNEYFALGQAAWAGAPYFPSDITKKKIDNSLQCISNIGAVIKEVDDSKKEKVDRDGEQLTNIVKYIYEISKEENIKSKQLWIDNIPETIYVDDLRKKYKIKGEKNKIEPIIGEFDDPYNQRQGIVSLKITNGGNAIVYGNANSGKETLISTLVYDIMKNYSTEEVQLYLMDFGSEALKVFKDSPHVGDVVFSNDTEKISRLFEKIQKMIKDRKEILSDYSGEYKLYINSNKEPMPEIVIIINNYESFFENYGNEYEDMLLTLTRDGVKCAISFIFTASTFRDVRYRLTQNFKQRIALQLNSEDDYLSIFDGLGKKRPSHMFGRGLVKLDEIYEFQTAKICEAENWTLNIRDTIDKANNKNELKAPKIPVLPDRVMINDISGKITALEDTPIGIIKRSLNIYTYNFKKDLISIIASKDINLAVQFIANISEIFNKFKNTEIIVLDSERIIQTGKNDLKESYQSFVSGIQQNNNKNKICIIIGIDKFINDLEGTDKAFYEVVKKADEIGNYNFIIVDNVTRIKNHQFSDWYKNYITGDNGIWVGNGINDQYLFTVNGTNKRVNNLCGNSFGFIIKQGDPVIVKLFGMKEEREENG